VLYLSDLETLRVEFLSRVSMAERDTVLPLLSVRPCLSVSVCLSLRHVLILHKRLRMSSYFLTIWYGRHSSFFSLIGITKFHDPRVLENLRFSTEVYIYIGNGTR